MNDIVIMIFSMTLLLIIGFVVGYAFATRGSLMAIENVNNWIQSTEANRWIEIGFI